MYVYNNSLMLKIQDIKKNLSNVTITIVTIDLVRC